MIQKTKCFFGFHDRYWSNAGAAKTVFECKHCGRMKIFKEDQRPIAKPDTAEGLLREIIQDHNTRYGTVGDITYNAIIERAKKLLNK